MIYLIVANQIMEVLTDMDEALEEARHYAPKVGDITVADMATGRKLIVTADGKATDMDANMRAVNRLTRKLEPSRFGGAYTPTAPPRLSVEMTLKPL